MFVTVPLLLRWNETFKMGENSIKCWFSLTLVTNLSILRQILMSKNECEPIFSCSTMNFLFWCLEDVYSRREWADSGDLKRRRLTAVS